MSAFVVITVRFLATLAAFMTVPAAWPTVRCVCPDGHIKFFCSGTNGPRCCCAQPVTEQAPVAPGQTISTATDEIPHCCSHRREVASSIPHDPQQAAPRGCCERSSLNELLVYSAEEDGDSFALEHAWLEAIPVDRVVAPRISSRCKVRRFLLPPPDLVIAHCHFTC